MSYPVHRLYQALQPKHQSFRQLQADIPRASRKFYSSGLDRGLEEPSFFRASFLDRHEKDLKQDPMADGDQIVCHHAEINASEKNS